MKTTNAMKTIPTILAACLLGMGAAQAEIAAPEARELNPDFTPALYRQLKAGEGKIEKILEKLSPDSACVILNAVYFKADWVTSFDAGATVKAKFQRPGADPVEVDMMSSESSYRVLRDKGLIAVELPYKNGASMVLVMPDTADGMAALEEQLSAPFVADLCGDLRKAQPERINLNVQKFKVATKYGLISAMKELGMVDAFAEDRADFKAMYGKTLVSIAQIAHKATLEVDEKGRSPLLPRGWRWSIPAFHRQPLRSASTVLSWC